MTELQEKFSAYDDLLEGVQVIGAEMEYLYVNHAVCDHAKLAIEDLLGNKMAEVFPGIEETSLYHLIKSCFGDHEARQFINEFKFPDGSTGYFSLRIQKVPEGVLVMSYDVTSQVLAEIELARYNQLIERAATKKISNLQKQNEELYLQAIIDELTGLYNRRYFLDRLKEEFTRYQRYKGDLCLSLLDVDDFKAINDTYGHDIGDMVLADTARTLIRSLREIDVIARIGGDEFALLMPETSLNSAKKLMNRARGKLRKNEMIKKYNITFSVGLQQLHQGNASIHALFKSADNALYKAKSLGKDMIIADDIIK
jgi:diguanylate cyclase (GGDEF)-like protein